MAVFGFRFGFRSPEIFLVAFKLFGFPVEAFVANEYIENSTGADTIFVLGESKVVTQVVEHQALVKRVKGSNTAID